VKTVLGLSVTPGGVAWVLIGRRAATRDTSELALLDDDFFEVDADDELAARCAAAARGARAIAASSGDEIRSIGLTWAEGLDTRVEEILGALTSAGFGDVRKVPRHLIAGATASEDDEAGGAEGAEDAHADDAGVLETALAAAQAVATGAVPAARVVCLLPSRCRHTSKAVRIAGTAAAAVIVALSTVGSTFIADQTKPREDPSLSAAGPAQIVTAALPRAPRRPPVRASTVRTVSKPAYQPATTAAPSHASLALPRTPAQPAVRQPVQQAAPDENGGTVMGVQHLPSPDTAPALDTAPAPALATPHLPENLPVGITPVPGAPPLPGPAVLQTQATTAQPGAAAPVAGIPAPVPAPVPELGPISLNPLVAGLP
jgi:hypothetical protein